MSVPSVVSERERMGERMGMKLDEEEEEAVRMSGAS